MSDKMHHSHDTEPFAQAFNVRIPRVHTGIFWCNDCQEEFIPEEVRSVTLDDDEGLIVRYDGGNRYIVPSEIEEMTQTDDPVEIR